MEILNNQIQISGTAVQGREEGHGVGWERDNWCAVSTLPALLSAWGRWPV